MLDALGLVKTAADLLPRAWTSWQERRDPVRAQATRVLRAFESHGIARTQIVRLLPPGLALPMTAFASAQSLRGHLTPALLDWVAEFFLLERAWFDGVQKAAPHSSCRHNFYKQPGALHQWLIERIGNRVLDFKVYLLKADALPVGEDSSGPFVILLAETHCELDGEFHCRYQLLSGGAHFDHVPCVVDLIASCAVYDALNIDFCGLVLPRDKLLRLEDGAELIIEAMRYTNGYWKPEALLYGARGESPWVCLVRQQAIDRLHAAGLDAANACLNGSKISP